MRKQISQKLRFEVFKRDAFACQYCGETPPNVVLEVDHIMPVKKGGGNDINNLITSCFNCNRGKSATELTSLPKKLNQNIEEIKEKELQYKEYSKILQKIEKRKNAEIEIINDTYQKYNEGFELTEQFKNTTVKMFISKLHYLKVNEAMEKACVKTNNSRFDYCIKYFCGICWNMIKEGGNE